jgi:hypothetical protein
VPENEKDHLLLVDSYREEDENDRALSTLLYLLISVGERWKPGMEILDSLRSAIIKEPK